MNNPFLPLRPINKQELLKENGVFNKIILLLLPLLIYEVVDFVVLYFTVFGAKVLAENNETVSRILVEDSSYISVLSGILAIVAASIIFIPFIRREHPVLIAGKEPFNHVALTMALGITAAIFINCLFSLTGITTIGTVYEGIASRQMSLPIFVGIVFYGILTPFIEEIVYRLLFFRIALRELGAVAAFILSPLIFGLYHGNIPQALYGIVMGTLITWVYYRFGSFLYPYLFHACANIVIYIIMHNDALNSIVMKPYMIGIFGGLSLGMILYIGSLKASD